MQGVFFCLSDKAIVRGRRKLLLCYPLLFNFPFFHVHFMAVTTAVERLSIMEPHCTLQSVLFFPPILLSEQVSRSQRVGGNIKEENTLNLNSNSNLLSVLSAHPCEGKQINLSSSDTEADSWRLMSLSRSVTGLFNQRPLEFVNLMRKKNKHP